MNERAKQGVGEDDPGSPSESEVAYGRWLRAYPAVWRRRHRDAVLATLLDVAAEQGRTRPGAGDVWDLVRHGLAERVRVAVPGPRSRGVAAQLALAVGSAVALVCFVLGEWRLTAGYGPLRSSDRLDPFLTTGPLLYAVWGLVLMAFLAGAARVARGVAGLALLTVPVLVALDAYTDLVRPPLTVLLPLAFFAAVVAAAGFGVSRRARLRVAALAVALGGYLLVAAQPMPVVDDPRYDFYRSTGTSAVLRTMIGLTVVLVVVSVVAFPWRRHWLPGAALVSLPWTVEIVSPFQRVTLFEARENALVEMGLTAAVVVLAAAWLAGRISSPRTPVLTSSRGGGR